MTSTRLTFDEKAGVLAVFAGAALNLTAMTGLAPDRDVPPTFRPPEQSRAAPVWAEGADLETMVVVYAGPVNRSHQKNELDSILDSMLISDRIPPGVPFEDRVGQVDDDRVLAVMRDVDETLGGRIEWPNVYVTEHLDRDFGAIGQYNQGARQSEGRTATVAENTGREGSDRRGILLDKAFVEDELADEGSRGKSLRSLLVHELQHATTADNEVELIERAATNGWSYQTYNGLPWSESRADFAALVEAEMAQREGGSLRLNELKPTDRRAVISEVLTGYLHPGEDVSRDYAEGTLLYALKDEAYIHSGRNQAWNEADLDLRTFTYAQKGSGSTFVPTGMSSAARRAEPRSAPGFRRRRLACAERRRFGLGESRSG